MYSYVAATVRDQFPKKDQAIVIESISDIPIDEYIQEIGKLVSPNNIRFVSRVSGNRVCMYLDSKQTVEDLTSKHSSIVIKDNTLELRPLITKFKRLILSNVCPIIPHYVLTDELQKRNIRTNSSMTFMRAGMSSPGYAHILSFRRQIYIHPEDESKVPESLPIKFEETTYWIYPSTDTIKCFTCKQVGHIAKHCHSKQERNTTPIVELESNTTKKQDSKDAFQTEKPDKDNFPELPPPKSISKDCTNTGHKRQHSDTASTLSSTSTKEPLNSLNINNTGNEENRTIIDKKVKKISKKVKTVTPHQGKTTDELLAPLEKIIGEAKEKYILDFLQYKSFFDNATGSKNPALIAKDYCENLESLIDMMNDMYSHLNDRSAKSRHTKITKRIIKSLQDTKGSSDEESASYCSETNESP